MKYLNSVPSETDWLIWKAHENKIPESVRPVRQPLQAWVFYAEAEKLAFSDAKIRRDFLSCH